jgi:ribosomal protein L11 methyltransferase
LLHLDLRNAFVKRSVLAVPLARCQGASSQSSTKRGGHLNWLEISLSVDGETAEAVAEVLSRFAPNSVMTEQGIQHLNDEDAGTPAGNIVVRAYLPDDDRVQDTRQQIERALHFLGMILPVPAPSYRNLADTNWMEAWKEHYRPIPIGRRLLILPAWLESGTPGRVAVKIDPGMAFGTGTHPSTQLCLEFLDEILNESLKGPPTFIDVGCGSGILSIAALKLGVVSALGVDVDAEALINARENGIANGLGPELILGLGSVREILEGRFPFSEAPLVTANILAPVIVQLLQEGLAKILAPGGSMILAGILMSQGEDVAEACRQAGLTVVSRRRIDDWIALCVSN